MELHPVAAATLTSVGVRATRGGAVMPRMTLGCVNPDASPRSIAVLPVLLVTRGAMAYFASSAAHTQPASVAS